MPLPTPAFDMRSYREILDEALARVPVHNPEWTNLSDSDPGVTLLQVFAFMTESLLYRANQIPDRNRARFLRLLGVGLRPPAPTRGMVVFENPRGPLREITLDPQQELFAGAVPFRTTNGLQVLPIDARIYYKKRLPEARRAEVDALYKELYASFLTSGRSPAYYETTAFDLPQAGTRLPVVDLATDTVDSALWLALLARRGDTADAARAIVGGKVLTLGVLPALAGDGCVLYPAAAPAAANRPRLVFEVPNIADARARYLPLPARTDVDPLAHPAILTLALPEERALGYWQDLDPLEAGVGDYPPALEDAESQARVITWIRVRLADPTSTGTIRQTRAAISWLGVNAAAVLQRALVASELLPPGTGEPDQTAALANRPVLEDSMVVTVNGEEWRRTDDLAAAPAEIQTRSPRLSTTVGAAARQDPRVYTVDRESGAITFGDGARGARPPRGASIVASYAYGGGKQGLAGINAINKGPALPAGLKVFNRVPTWGGDDGESVGQAERRVPSLLHHRDRLVSVADVREITWQTPGVSIGRIEVRPLFHPELPERTSEGVVTVLVVPKEDELQPRAPRPGRLFLESICAHLEPRRILTTELHVRGPKYEPIWIAIGIDAVPGREEGLVRDAVRLAVERFLSPLEGGFDGTGWPLDKAVEALEIWAAATRVDAVAKVNGVRLGDRTGAELPRVPLSGLQLPQVVAIGVEVGDPPALADVRGETAPDPDAATEMLPVPVVPRQC